MLLCGLTSQSVVVDADQFAKAQPVVFRYRLDTPHVLGGGLTLGALGRAERRVGVLAPRVSLEYRIFSSSLQISVRLSVG